MARSLIINGVAGATVNEHKRGSRYRNFTQYADEYDYDDVADTYVRDGEWTQRKNEQMLHGYGFFKIADMGETDLPENGR